jgi:hypothetical protein
LDEAVLKFFRSIHDERGGGHAPFNSFMKNSQAPCGPITFKPALKFRQRGNGRPAIFV